MVCGGGGAPASGWYRQLWEAQMGEEVNTAVGVAAGHGAAAREFAGCEPPAIPPAPPTWRDCPARWAAAPGPRGGHRLQRPAAGLPDGRCILARKSFSR